MQVDHIHADQTRVTFANIRQKLTASYGRITIRRELRFFFADALPASLEAATIVAKTLAQQLQYRDTVAVSPIHTSQKRCRDCGDPNNLFQEWHQDRQRTIANANGPKTHDDDKAVLVFQPACLCSNSCENDDALQMRIMDHETRQGHPSSVDTDAPLLRRVFFLQVVDYS